MKRYIWVILAIVVWIGLAALSYQWANAIMASVYSYRSPFARNPLPAAAAVGKPVSRHVVSIVVDGLRVDTAANAQVMPFLNQLRAQGASATIHSGTPSYSAPGWSVLGTGAWPDLSDGPALNPEGSDKANPWTQDNIFSAAHNAGLHTAIAGSSFYGQIVPAVALDDVAFTDDETDAGDRFAADEGVKFIQSGKYDYLLVHFGQVDHAGHEQGGPLDPRWNAAASRVDGYIRQVVSALDLSQDTVLVFSDHGHIDMGGHGGQDAIVLVQPFVMAGANVKADQYGDIQQVDVAPTLAALLGSNIPAVAQGRALTEMLALSAAQLDAIHQAAIAQQKTLYEAYAAAMGVSPADLSVAAAQEPVAVYQTALQGIKNDRLNRERLLRGIFAALLALVPLYFIIRYRSRSLIWMFAAAAVYLLVFNLRYAVLQGRSYSLSSVITSSELISSTATSALIAFFIAWLVALLGLRLFRRPPLQAANFHVALTFITLYSLGLPVLWNLFYNGFVATWTLPEVGSMFLGFLSIMQMLIITLAGLALLGVTPLAAWAYGRVRGNGERI
jgi:hypothetical protein